MRLLLLAPPGAGKGTQGGRLAEHYDVTHISSGDMLRTHIQANDELGQRVKSYLAAGDLVPDDVMSDLILEPAFKAAARGGYILDGFPRTLDQARFAFAEACAAGAELQAVIFLDVPDEVLVKRLLARGRGTDDTEATIRHRLEVYHGETEPLVAYYEDRSLLRRVNGDQSVEAVTDACIAALADIER